jgi:O-antigen/teichoic acid export membrane protein
MLILAGLMIFDEFYRQTNMAMLLFMLPWFFAFLVMFVLLIHRIRVFDTVSEKIEYKSWFVVGVSALPYNLSLFTIPYIAVIGAEIFLVNESSVGIFATAAFFSQLVANNFSACVQTIALPPIASAVYTKSMSEVRGILNKNIICMGVISVILVIIVLLLGKDILLIYGQKYTAATEDLVVFMVMQGVILSSFLAAPTLLYIGKTEFVAISSLVLILLIVIFMSLFGYVFQEIGLALGILLAVAIVFIAQIAYAYKLTFETSQ